MKKTAPWWTSLIAFLLAMVVSIVSALYIKENYPDWMIEYQLAFIIFSVIISEIILTIIVKIIYHDCGDECRNQYDIKNIRSQYRKRK